MADLQASVIDPSLELRVEIRATDGVGGRTPALSVYRDGTVLRPGDPYGAVVTRLTADGLDLLKRTALGSGLLDSSGSIKGDPTYVGAGFMVYAIEIRRGDDVVRRGTSNVVAEGDQGAADALIALAESLVDLEDWLPVDAWSVGPAAAQPYVAGNFLLKVTIWDNAATGPAAPTLDASEVAWPFDGTLATFGAKLAEPPLGSGSTSRCGPLSLREAAVVQHSLAQAPWSAPMIPISERMQASLAWASAGKSIDVSIANLLPEDPIDCEVDGTWP